MGRELKRRDSWFQYHLLMVATVFRRWECSVGARPGLFSWRQWGDNRRHFGLATLLPWREESLSQISINSKSHITMYRFFLTTVGNHKDDLPSRTSHGHYDHHQLHHCDHHKTAIITTGTQYHHDNHHTAIYDHHHLHHCDHQHSLTIINLRPPHYNHDHHLPTC